MDKSLKTKSKAMRHAMLIATVLILIGCGQIQHDKNGNAIVPSVSTPATRDMLILEELQKQTELLKEIRDKK